MEAVEEDAEAHTTHIILRDTPFALIRHRTVDMYELHWRLTASPFRAHCGPEFFCRLPGHQSALLKLKYVLEQRQASAALIGPAGIGKSFLLRVLETELPPRVGPIIGLNFPFFSPLELVRALTLELAGKCDVPVVEARGMDEWLLAWERLLRHYRAQGRLPVFIVDDAHLIDDRAVWQTWQLLLTYRERTGNEFSMLFVGQPELLGRLQRLPPLEERLALACPLTALSAEQSAEYILHRLRIAGRMEPVFDASALDRIWECAEGIPRRIDRLCDFSLLVGYAEDLTLITADQIDGVSQELGGRAAA